MRPLSLSKEEFSECYLDLRKSMLLVDDFISQYNQDKPLRKQLRASHRSLMHELLSIYRIVLWKEQSGGALLIPDTPLPYFSTNNVQLAKKIKCSGRTIQNLRQRLQEGRLILDEVWHGSNANYEMRLNPEMIFLGRRGDQRNWISLFEAGGVPQGAGSQAQGAPSNEMWKTTIEPVETVPQPQYKQGTGTTPYEEKTTVFSANFSPKCTLSLQDTNQLNQLETGQCGNRAETDANRAGDQRRIFFTGYETIGDRLNTPPQVARHPPMARGAGGVERGEGSMECVVSGVGQTFGEVVTELPDKLGRRIFREVSKVWEVALEELYAGTWMADTERERAKARLAEYYVDARPERYAAGTEEICERIRLVRKWIERGRQAGQERWVPIPSVYFDHRNTRGFGRTKAWFKQHRVKRREIGDNIAVARAVRRYERCLRGDDRSQGPMEVYQGLVNRLQERGEAVMMRFCDMVAV